MLYFLLDDSANRINKSIISKCRFIKFLRKFTFIDFLRLSIIVSFLSFLIKLFLPLFESRLFTDRAYSLILALGKVFAPSGVEIEVVGLRFALEDFKIVELELIINV